MLCGLLESTGVLGHPRSWFREADEAVIAHELGVLVVAGRPADFAQYTQAVAAAGRTPNGVFAARIMWGTVEHVRSGLDTSERNRDLDVLQAVLGPLAVVHLRRVDVVEQAVSWGRAEQTGYWQQGDTARAEPSLDLTELLDLVDTIREHEAAWQAWFLRNDIQPVEVTYDSVVDDPAGVVHRIAAHLGVAIPEDWQPRPQTTRQADGLNQHWASELRAALHGSREL